MGMMGLGKSCSSSPYSISDSSPNPNNFKIIWEQCWLHYLLLMVEYPDAKNYEGKKLLLYKGFTSSKQLLKATAGKLDPHFSSSAICPIARFKPDNTGYEMALHIMKECW